MSLTKVLRKRTVEKTKFLKLQEKIETALASNDVDISQVAFYSTELGVSETKVCEAYDTLLNECEDGELDNFLAEYEQLKEVFSTLSVSLRRAEAKLKHCAVENPVKDAKPCRDVKLPKLELPIFSGAIEQWLSFSDLFTATVHENPSLSDAQKLQYLKSVLRGDAAKIIQSIPIVNANYAIAWDLLSERYSNNRELVFALIKRLMSQPAVQSESPSAILNLVDTTSECIRSLEVLGQKVQGFSETMVVYVVQQKLDASTKLWWERQLKGDKLSALSELATFLKDYACSLQASKPAGVQRRVYPQKVTSMTTTVKNNSVCKMCKGNHSLFKCPEFLKLSVNDRVQYVKRNLLCFNCLGEKHRAGQCKSTKTCYSCAKKHNSLLHYERREKAHHEEGEGETKLPFFSDDAAANQGATQAIPSSVSRQHTNEPGLTSCFGKFDNYQQPALLATAFVRVKDATGCYQLCRAVFDGGAQTNFITEAAMQRLGLRRKNANIQITCLGAAPLGATQGVADVTFTPHFDTQKTYTAKMFVLKKITNDQPHIKCNSELFSNIRLADPKWFEPAPIDILLGVTVSLSAIRGEKIFNEPGVPFAINSDFGWLIAGNSDVSAGKPHSISVNHVDVQDDQLVKSFWELESVPTAELLSDEEKFCERHFEKTHFRDEEGRYVVRLPFKADSKELGDSRAVAVSRILALEKRLRRQTEVYDGYRAFIQEYLDLEHMERVPVSETVNPEGKTFYLPHHPVIKETSSTTKLRVVFDASAKSSTGVSLNDNLLVGAKVQQELFFILLRFRTHPIAVTADIAKMFRQIRMNTQDCDFQRILWRNDPSEPLGEYRLKTVTYGTACAPFLATRVLQQLAIDERVNFPEASKVTLRDFYVDDLLSGAPTAETAIELTRQLREMMNRGGFELRKWFSNDCSVLETVPVELRGTNCELNIKGDSSVKVLGITWHPSRDNFSVCVSPQLPASEPTKRNILSELARIFDPLGWLAPFVISAKILLQQLWNYELSWDEPVPDSFRKRWKNLFSELSVLNSISIPRVVVVPSSRFIEIHGFCDASERAYGAVIFLRSVCKDSFVSVKLLTAKTRVAPLKSVTLPRLELCGALLLARLLEVVSRALELKIDKVYAWTDSTVVLSWLSSEPKRWQTFVANRVAEIQRITTISCWSHVQGRENPADCASRGLSPSELVSHDLWWHGPQWLHQADLVIPVSTEIPVHEAALKEERKKFMCAVSQVKEQLPVISNVSSFSRLQRILAWCLRFVNNVRVPPSERRKGFLTSDELCKATTWLLREVQTSAFPVEIQCLKSGRDLPKNSKVSNLCPYLDSEGLLRVGGRLQRADLREDQMHPIVLPRKHHVTNLIVKHYHLNHLHAGPQLLLSAIRQRFWILCGRDVVRRFVKGCVKCFRLSATSAKQIMADLPPSRVLPSRAFTTTGVDFAGPFHCKSRSGRGVKTFKCYVAIFVCFSTRAIHLELVSDLSTQSFLAALKRFIARRGKPSEIVSDCATNFKGASRELKEMYRFVRSSERDEKFMGFTSSEGIRWSFNPPSAPHFGGLWEAGVKSMKFHLRRTMGNSVLTYEEFLTLLTQVEACLNSRPLCPLSSDPSDFAVLTPGHFLVGAPLTSVPEPDLTEVPVSRLRRWQVVQRVFQHFWKRWSTEYLARLQQRPKWCSAKPNLQVGDLVLIKSELVPALQWKLGRVTAVHPGVDNKVRVVTVKTGSGELKRPVTKLCQLPLE